MPQNNAKLVAELAAHLRSEPKRRGGKPIVIEEDAGFKDYLHVYVIWPKFRSLDEMERSRIVLDAIDKAYGKERMLRVSVAMGLTMPEAKELEIAT